jgi:hypothetical protein
MVSCARATRGVAQGSEELSLLPERAPSEGNGEAAGMVSVLAEPPR